MAGLGLPAPSPTATATAATQPMFAPAMQSASVGGLMNITSLSAMMEQEKAAANAQLEAQQAQPLLQGLAGHIKTFWTQAENAKRTIETELLDALYARRGEYTSEKKQQIQEQNQPEIYMLVASAKMRQIEALLRDVLIGTGTDKPWTIKPTPVPKLPPQEVQRILQYLQSEVEQAIMAGFMPTPEEVRERLRLYRDQLETRMREEARVRCERMEQKMEDQLVEGGFLDALDQFIVDLATFKTAFVKGPVVRKKPQLDWDDAGQVVVKEELTLEWERVSPFDMYPAPWAKDIGESGVPLIQRHRLTREELNQLIGVEGYNEPAIRKVIEEYGRGGLRNWLSIDSELAAAEGKDQLAATTNTGTIDAIQYWGSASGQMLIDWGMDKKQVPDPTKEYQVEAWLIGTYVIKAVLNGDPLARRPYYGLSFQRVPGSVWGNSPYDLMRDCQDMCNAAARALAANLGISSGPQVAILSDRIPSGEEVTQMFPWKIWQFESDPMGNGSSKPIEFFQPQSNAQELMTVYERFSILADEAVGVPRYMAGFNEGSGGAGRTASGMSMMIGNASKVIKQVVGSIDIQVLTKVLERLYYYNMRYGEDADLKGDVRIVARGAMSLATKEAAQVRRNEFLAATANPFDMQIIGMEGRAEVLRSAAKNLDMNTDKVVPPVAVIKEKAMMMAMQQQQAAAAQAEGQQGDNGQGGRNASTPPKKQGGGQQLQNGEAVTDVFEPA